MADERLRDGKRIAQLLASELDANENRLVSLSLADADPDAEPTADGAFAYAVVVEGDEREDGETRDPVRLAEVYVHDDRARVEFLVAPDVAAEAADEADLRVRPKATRPPRTLVFVEDGAQVKWVVPAFETVVQALVDTA